MDAAEIRIAYNLGVLAGQKSRATALPRRRFGKLGASLTVLGFPSVALARMPEQEQAAANEVSGT